MCAPLSLFLLSFVFSLPLGLLGFICFPLDSRFDSRCHRTCQSYSNVLLRFTRLLLGAPNWRPPVCSLVFHFLGHRSNLVRRLVLASAWRAGTCGQRGGKTRPDYIRETPRNTGQSEQPNDLFPLATAPEYGAVRA